METGSLPSTTIYSTWIENIEVWSIDDDQLFDLSNVIEVIIKVRDPRTRFDELILTMTGGDIVIPSPGIIQWRVEAARMGVLDVKVYEVIMLLQDVTDTVALILGLIAVVG